MDKESFYMQLCHILINKFCNNHAVINKEEWDATVGKDVTIKHRINADGHLEVVTLVEDKVN